MPICLGFLQFIPNFARMRDNNEEIFPIVDDSGKVLGKATRGECHNGSRLLHPVVHLHVFNSFGEVYYSAGEMGYGCGWSFGLW